MRQKLEIRAQSCTEAEPGARFKAFEQDGKRLRLVESTRVFVEVNGCRKAHVGYVIEDDLEADFDSRMVRYAQGDGLFIADGDAARRETRSAGEAVRPFLVEDPDPI